MNMRFEYSVSDIPSISQELLRVPGGRVFALTGSLGAGKTSLARAMLRQLGVQDAITSPTYAYVNTYTSSVCEKVIHHFDVYRLQDVTEFIALGFDEYLNDENALVIIEWPECIAQLLPPDTCYVDIQHYDEISRVLHLSRGKK